MKKVAILEQRMIENLDKLENIWLKNKPYLCGDEISISDLVAACELEQPSKKLFFYNGIIKMLIFIFLYRNSRF